MYEYVWVGPYTLERRGLPPPIFILRDRAEGRGGPRPLLPHAFFPHPSLMRRPRSPSPRVAAIGYARRIRPRGGPAGHWISRRCPGAADHRLCSSHALFFSLDSNQCDDFTDDPQLMRFDFPTVPLHVSKSHSLKNTIVSNDNCYCPGVSVNYHLVSVLPRLETNKVSPQKRK